MKNRHQPFEGLILGAGRVLLVLLLSALVPAIAVAETEAPLHERALQIVADASLGTIGATLIGTEAKHLDAYDGVHIEIKPRFDPIRNSTKIEEDAVRQYDGTRSRHPQIVLELDLSHLEVPAGATGFEIRVRGGRPGRKPLSWLVVNHWYYGGNQIGIEAITRCHAAWMWTHWATWTNIIYNQSHCPTHGAQLNAPGSSTQIQTQFDGAYFTRYKTWRDGATTYWTFYPGGF